MLRTAPCGTIPPMSTDTPPATGPLRAPAPATPCPWDTLDEAGTGLIVEHFLTTTMSRVGNALRRTITVPYADAFQITVTVWRRLSGRGHAHTLPFGQRVRASATDKALVSRTLRLLESRGLVAIAAEGHTPRKKLLCTITPEGQALHDQIIPIARQRQAAVLRVLSPEERRVLFTALGKLHQHCVNTTQLDDEE